MTAMTAYKLTDQDGYTRRGLEGETLWTVGSVVAPTGRASRSRRYDAPQPCGPGVLHAYIAPEVAVLGDPIHANYAQLAAELCVATAPRLFRIETVNGGKWHTDGLKRWTSSSVRVLEELPLPVITLEEAVAWVICMDSRPTPNTREWAVKWLSGVDRTAESALRAGIGHDAARTAYNAAKAKDIKHIGSYPFADAARRFAASEAMWMRHESALVPALLKARAILAGEIPAEWYDR